MLWHNTDKHRTNQWTATLLHHSTERLSLAFKCSMKNRIHVEKPLELLPSVFRTVRPFSGEEASDKEHWGCSDGLLGLNILQIFTYIYTYIYTYIFIYISLLMTMCLNLIAVTKTEKVVTRSEIWNSYFLKEMLSWILNETGDPFGFNGLKSDEYVLVRGRVSGRHISSV